eukprot:symbB.v1.2.033715.t1/scaffold4229.1/size42808/1
MDLAMDWEDTCSYGVAQGYETVKVIGRGSFGKALLVRDRHGTQRVMKVVELQNASERRRQQAPMEAEMLQRLGPHPHIVRFHESFQEDFAFVIVMDFSRGGDLRQQAGRSLATTESAMAPLALPRLAPTPRSSDNHVTVHTWPIGAHMEDDRWPPSPRLRGIWGAMDLPPMPPMMSTVYGKRELPLRLGELQVECDDLSRTLAHRNPSVPRLPPTGVLSQTAPESMWRFTRTKGTHNGKVSRHSRSWRELLPKVQKEAKPPEDRRELPIAPKSSKKFFARTAKMCIRVVTLQNTKVKLKISGTKGSVLAEPLAPSMSGNPRLRSSPSGGTAQFQAKATWSQDFKEPLLPHSPKTLSRPTGFFATPEPINSPESILTPSPSVREVKKSSSFQDGKLCQCGQLFTAESPDLCKHCGSKRQSSAELRQNMISNAKEDVRVSVFNKLQDHNEVHRDDLAKGLELCGFVGIREAWVESACEANSKYSTLEVDEFLSFVRSYEGLQDNFYKSTFEEADLDNSGTMEAGELAEMLQKLGIEPMSHVLDEVIREVDDGNGELEFKEFKHLMDLLVVREGFTSSEYDSYVELFNNFDVKKTGEISDEDLRTILKWVTCSLPEEVLQDILKDVDADGSGSISQREYLRCLRKIREHELDLVRVALGTQPRLPKEQVTHLFRDLGYILWDEIAIMEAAREAELQEDQLDLSNLWRLLLTYRHREGMRNSELASIDAAFRSEDQGTGELTNLDVPTAIRSLGYQVSFEAMQSVLRYVDVNDSGRLDKMQFRKVVRMLQEP